jgi:hypothetical protein
MNYEVVITDDAWDEIQEAYDWFVEHGAIRRPVDRRRPNS